MENIDLNIVKLKNQKNIETIKQGIVINTFSIIIGIVAIALCVLKELHIVLFINIPPLIFNLSLLVDNINKLNEELKFNKAIRIYERQKDTDH